MACRSSCPSFAECVLHPFQATNDQHLSQSGAAQAVYNGHNVFVWLPTGYGKSLCYQTLPTSSSLVPRPPTRGTRLLQALVQRDRILRHRLDPAHLVILILFRFDYAHAQTVCTTPRKGGREGEWESEGKERR